MTTHYLTLEVIETASIETIKGAYKHLSQKWHPDKNPRDKEKAETIIKKINAAYAVLSDPVEKRAYDERLQNFRRKKEARQQRKQEAWLNEQQRQHEQWLKEQQRKQEEWAITNNDQQPEPEPEPEQRYEEKSNEDTGERNNTYGDTVDSYVKGDFIASQRKRRAKIRAIGYWGGAIISFALLLAEFLLGAYDFELSMISFSLFLSPTAGIFAYLLAEIYRRRLPDQRKLHELEKEKGYKDFSPLSNMLMFGYFLALVGLMIVVFFQWWLVSGAQI